MIPNEQQTAVVDHMDGPCIVLAVPGSGKTTSVTERVKRLIQKGVSPKTILAITFTNKAAKEMRTRIALAVGPDIASLMTVSTFHSLCARLLRANARLVGLTPDFSIYDEDDSERLVKQCVRAIEGDGYKPSEKYMKGIFGYLEGQRNACMTRAAAYDRYNVDGNQGKVIDRYFSELRKANAIDFNGLISEVNLLLEKDHATRDLYRSRFKYISVDEVQDTNAAQYELVKHLGLGHLNVLIVGDLDQCIPDGTVVRTLSGPRPIENVIEGEMVESAAGRGRTKFAKVTKTIRNRFCGNLVQLRTASGTIQTTPNHVLFGRLDMLEDKHFVYLMQKESLGYRIGRTSSVRSTGGLKTLGLKIRMNQEHADRVWLLRVCDSLSEAAYYEAFFATKYGLPTICFHGNGRSIALDQGQIDEMFNAIDTSSRAARLFEDMEMNPEYTILPTASRENSGRSTLTLSMFGNNNQSHHLLTFHGENESLREAFEKSGLKCTPSKRDLWRFRSSNKDYVSLSSLASNIKATGCVSHINRKSFLVEQDGNSSPFLEMPASHFHPGMKIARVSGDSVVEDIVIEKTSVPYDGYVNDLTVEDVSNFVADNTVCHNSIYKFRAACPENILQFEKDFHGCKLLMLEKNYRSSPEILKHSQILIENNLLRKGTTLKTDNQSGKPPRIIGCDSDDSMADSIAGEAQRLIKEGVPPGEIVVLYRTNSASRVLEAAFRARDVKYKLIGGLSFFDRKEVKASLSILKLLCNKNDIMSFGKAVEACCKGIGDKGLEAISNIATTSSVSMMDAAAEYAKSSSLSAAAVRPFVACMAKANAAAPGRSLLAIARETVLWDRMEKESSTVNDRCQNISELAIDAEKHCQKKGGTLSGYLQQISLLSNADDEAEEGLVKMMTMHACKGLEFDAVMISHCNHDILPHSRGVHEARNEAELVDTLEEERRLLYVGMTRARKRLSMFFSKSKHKMVGDKPTPMYPSMFLFETGIPSGDLRGYAPNGPLYPPSFEEDASL